MQKTHVHTEKKDPKHIKDICGGSEIWKYQREINN